MVRIGWKGMVPDRKDKLMSQTLMMPVFEEIAAAEAARLEVQRIANLRWESWGREIGLQTDEIRKRATFPKWAWDDYSI